MSHTLSKIHKLENAEPVEISEVKKKKKNEQKCESRAERTLQWHPWGWGF